MPATNNEQQSAYSYWSVAEGGFRNNRAETSANTIEGKLVGVFSYDDEGNAEARPPIKAGKRVAVLIADDEGVHRINFKPWIYFASSFASRIGQVQDKAEIRMSVRPGRDNPKVSFCNIEVQDGEGQWTQVEYIEMPRDEAERTAKVLEVVDAHPANNKNKKS